MRISVEVLVKHPALVKGGNSILKLLSDAALWIISKCVGQRKIYTYKNWFG